MSRTSVTNLVSGEILGLKRQDMVTNSRLSHKQMKNRALRNSVVPKILLVDTELIFAKSLSQGFIELLSSSQTNVHHLG